MDKVMDENKSTYRLIFSFLRNSTVNSIESDPIGSICTASFNYKGWTLKIILMTVLLFSSVVNSDDDYNVVIKLFKHPYQSTVVLQHDFDGDQNYTSQELEKISPLTYGAKINLNDGQHYFNFVPKITYEEKEIIDEIPALTGIRASSIHINGFEITNEYIVDGSSFDYNAVFSLHYKDQMISVGDGESLDIPNVPAEAYTSAKYVRWRNPDDIPEAGFTQAVIWLDMLQQRDNDAEGIIQIDHIRLYSVSDGVETLITSDEFFEADYAGTYIDRYPYFANNIFQLPTPALEATVDYGILFLPISEKGHKVWHLWNTTRGEVPLDSDYLIARVKVKLDGPIYLIMGIDFWKAESGNTGLDINNTEAGSTGWYFGDMGWKEIELVLQ